jgi:hypothetical protein
MKSQHCLHVLFWTILLLSTLVSCVSAQTEAISLASFTENYVDVSICLERNSAGNYVLSATFTPPQGYHLYSKDIPITGIDGLGRPTLLELAPESLLKTSGPLLENVEAQVPDFGSRELLVYPPGAVTLSLPVELPVSNGWIEDELEVTYMACSAGKCKPPVVAKRVLVPIPGVDILDD